MLSYSGYVDLRVSCTSIIWSRLLIQGQLISIGYTRNKWKRFCIKSKSHLYNDNMERDIPSKDDLYLISIDVSFPIYNVRLQWEHVKRSLVSGTRIIIWSRLSLPRTAGRRTKPSFVRHLQLLVSQRATQTRLIFLLEILVVLESGSSHNLFGSSLAGPYEQCISGRQKIFLRTF